MEVLIVAFNELELFPALGAGFGLPGPQELSPGQLRWQEAGCECRGWEERQTKLSVSHFGNKTLHNTHSSASHSITACARANCSDCGSELVRASQPLCTAPRGDEGL